MGRRQYIMEEIELRFFDETMQEVDGVYDEVTSIMQEVDPMASKWLLRSRVELVYGPLMCSFTLHFFASGDVWIMGYNPSGEKDVMYNPDIRCLTEWCQENGWATPCPDFELVDGNIEFWKYFWEVNLIDSKYLENKFGPRKIDE